MRMPGFSAGAAVYKTDGHFHVSGTPGGEFARYRLVESALIEPDLSTSVETCATRCGGSAACTCHCLGGRYLPPTWYNPHGLCVLI